MRPEKIFYHKAAAQYLKIYYERNGSDNIFLTYRFLCELAIEAKKLAKAMSLKEMDYHNAIVATWFRYAGVTDIVTEQAQTMKHLLADFFNTVNYPEADRVIVQTCIGVVVENKYAETKVQQVASDAVYSQLAHPNFLENIIHIKEELIRLTGIERDELVYLQYFLSLFVNTRFYTEYANDNYTSRRETNFQLAQKRVRKLSEVNRPAGKEDSASILTNKETEDIFKIAFRNYNHLISVADAKASLLIRVNSTIITIMIAFVLSKAEKNMFLIWPALILVMVCMAAVLFSILASRPQNNDLLEDKTSHSYQRFFFGSFDLIDSNFRHARWDAYYSQLTGLFNSARETVYLEVCKESFNVRKVLSKKFFYLSVAYWIFVVGLLVSIIAFIIAIYHKSTL
jgi:hypothetical protein